LKYPILLAGIPSLVSLASSITLAQTVPAAQTGTDTMPPVADRPISGDGKPVDDWRFAATLKELALQISS